jgi:hypothetical protein
VLDEVGDAVGFSRLTAGAGLDPYAHGYGAEMFHTLGKHNEAVGQYGAAKVAFVVGHHRFIFDCRSIGLGRFSTRLEVMLQDCQRGLKTTRHPGDRAAEDQIDYAEPSDESGI